MQSTSLTLSLEFGPGSTGEALLHGVTYPPQPQFHISFYQSPCPGLG